MRLLRAAAEVIYLDALAEAVRRGGQIIRFLANPAGWPPRRAADLRHAPTRRLRS